MDGKYSCFTLELGSARGRLQKFGIGATETQQVGFFYECLEDSSAFGRRLYAWMFTGAMLTGIPNKIILYIPPPKIFLGVDSISRCLSHRPCIPRMIQTIFPILLFVFIPTVRLFYSAYAQKRVLSPTAEWPSAVSSVMA